MLFLRTKSESKKQWVEPESIKALTGIDWLADLRVDSRSTKEEDIEAAER
jgi:hypothetical protein